MGILIQRREIAQPNQRLTIDWAHPAAKRLTGLWLFNAPLPINLVTGERSSLTAGSFTQGADKSGRLVIHGGTSDVLQLAADWQTLLNWREGSMLAHILPPAGSSFSTHRALGTVAPGSNNNFQLMFAANNLYFDYNISASALGSGVRVGPVSGQTAGGIFLGTRHNDGVSSSLGRGSALYRNGVLIGSSSTATHATTTTAAPFGLAWSSTGPNNTQSGARTLLVATWRRALMPNEAADVSRNPLILLRPTAKRAMFLMPKPPSLEAAVTLPAIEQSGSGETGEVAAAALTLPALEAAGQIIDELTNGVATLPSLSADGTMPVGGLVDAELTLPVLAGGGDIVTPPFSGAVTLPKLTASATVVRENGGTVTLPAWSASGSVFAGREIDAALVLPLDVVGTLYTSTVDFAPVGLSLQIAGAVAVGTTLSGAVDLPALAITGGIGAISAIDLPPLTASAVMTSGAVVAGEFVLPLLAMDGAASTEQLVTAALALPPLACAATLALGADCAAQIVLPAHAAAGNLLCGSVIAFAGGLPGFTVDAQITQAGVMRGEILLRLPTVEAFVRAPLAQRFDAFSLNSETMRASRYPDYPVLAIARIGDVYVAAGPDGLFALTGKQDDGLPIDAVVRTGLEDFGSDKLKRCVDVYLGARSRGALELRIKHDGEDREADYHATRIAPYGVKNIRVKAGRGEKSRYWQFEIRNVDGADFEIDSLNPEMLETSRRVS